MIKSHLTLAFAVHQVQSPTSRSSHQLSVSITTHGSTYMYCNPALPSACLKVTLSFLEKLGHLHFSPSQLPYPIPLHSDPFLIWHFLYPIHTPSTMWFVTNVFPFKLSYYHFLCSFFDIPSLM
jgi:hypothetical protein